MVAFVAACAAMVPLGAGGYGLINAKVPYSLVVYPAKGDAQINAIDLGLKKISGPSNTPARLVERVKSTWPAGDYSLVYNKYGTGLARFILLVQYDCPESKGKTYTYVFDGSTSSSGTLNLALASRFPDYDPKDVRGFNGGPDPGFLDFDSQGNSFADFVLTIPKPGGTAPGPAGTP